MDYRRRQQTSDLVPNREVSIFILKQKEWVDVFSGNLKFLHDLQANEFRVVFKVEERANPHVYILQPKIRRKGPKAFVVRAVGESQTVDAGECILAFRFENDMDSYNFQFFMEQRQTGDHMQQQHHYRHSHGHLDQHTRQYSSRRNKMSSQGSYMQGSYINGSKSPSMMSVPTLDGSVRSREQPHIQVLPLTAKHLHLHNARNPPRPRNVADLLRIQTS